MSLGAHMNIAGYESGLWKYFAKLTRIDVTLYELIGKSSDRFCFLLRQMKPFEPVTDLFVSQLVPPFKGRVVRWKSKNRAIVIRQPRHDGWLSKLRDVLA